MKHGRFLLFTLLISILFVLDHDNSRASGFDLHSGRKAIPGEIIVAFEVPDASAQSVSTTLLLMNWPAYVESSSLFLPEVLFEMDQTWNHPLSVARLKTNPQISPDTAARDIQQIPRVLWAAPNYEYRNGPRQIPSSHDFFSQTSVRLSADDPLLAEQSHHDVMETRAAWETIRGNPQLIIAIADDGIDIHHEDLRNVIWTNPGEIPGNGIDDDRNYYVDDTHGWDFANNSNDPSPNGGYHGTHVAGIVGAEAGNGIGVAGTAAGATLLPIQFKSSEGRLTSATIAQAYAYAANHGARILTTSHSIDQFVGDTIFERTLDYVYDQGVLLFNSAGNGYDDESARTQFKELLLVCSTRTHDNVDEATASTNRGPGVDLCAPGSSGASSERGFRDLFRPRDEGETDGGILSTLPGNQYGRRAGTSMSTPNAAGVAALIWSKNLSWTRDQVAAQLLGTCDDISEANDYKEWNWGSGRVNARRAVTESIPPPTVIGLQETLISDEILSTAELHLFTKRVFDPSSANEVSNYELLASGPDEVFETEDDLVIPLTLKEEYKIGTNLIGFRLENPLVENQLYRFRAKRTLKDPFGQNLNGDPDVEGSEDYEEEFLVLPVSAHEERTAKERLISFF